MRTMNITSMNGIDLTVLQKHPRVLELRLALFHSLMVAEYGDMMAMQFINTWCDMFSVNKTLINGIINQGPRIRKLRIMNRLRYRQEIIFMGMLFNEGRTEVAQKYLGLSKAYIYRKDFPYDPRVFLNLEWLNTLDDNIVLCSIPAYKVEAERFFDALDRFIEVAGSVSVAKQKV